MVVVFVMVVVVEGLFFCWLVEVWKKNNGVGYKLIIICISLYSMYVKLVFKYIL